MNTPNRLSPVTFPMSHIPTDKLLDGLTLPCSRKHGMVIARCRDLAPGDWFVLRNGHAPEPLRYQLEAIYPDAFRWDYLRDEPGLAEVRITKVRDLSQDELARHDGLLATRPSGSCGHHA